MSWEEQNIKYYLVKDEASETIFTGLEVSKTVKISYDLVEGICLDSKNKKIGAIKEFRDIVIGRSGVKIGLKDAKEIVEDCWETMDWGE